MDGEEKATTICILGLLVLIGFIGFFMRGCAETQSTERARLATECVKHHTPGECARILQVGP